MNKTLLLLFAQVANATLFRGAAARFNGFKPNKTMKYKTILVGMVWLVVALTARAQQDFSAIEVKAIPVAKNIYMLTGAGGNIGVSIGPDGILIVDDQFAPLAGKIAAAILAR
jgi:hypothetical protein